ncbi:MAG: GntR family transcriptional regulator [Gemmatimonadota bacterium]
MASMRTSAGGWRPPGTPPAATSLRTWIAEEAAAAVRAGELPPGTRLPSVRRLSDRIGVHRNTVGAAYRRLDDLGLVRLAHGAGCVVRGFDELGAPIADREQNGSEAPGRPPRPVQAISASTLRGFLAAARRQGTSTGEMADWLRRWDRAARARRLVVAAPEAELADVWVAELRLEAAGRGVELEVVGETCSSRSSDPRPEAGFVGPREGPGPTGRGRLERGEAPVAAPRELLGPLGRILPPWTDLVPLGRASGRALRRTVATVPPDALVVVVSASDRLRARLLTLVRLVEPAPVAAAVSPDQRERLRRLARVARLFVADVVSAPRVEEWAEPDALVPFRDLAVGVLDEVERRLLPAGT